jgi:hypothetical protein
MTREEFFADVWPLFSELWPRSADKMTGEQQASFFRVLSGRSIDDACAALRGWSDRSKYTPRPGDLHAVTRQVKSDDEAAETPKNAQILRNRWIHANPDMAEKFRRMSDAHVETHHLWMQWEMAEAAVITGRRGSAYPEWRAWQLARHWAGRRDDMPTREEYEQVEQTVNRRELARQFGWEVVERDEDGRAGHAGAATTPAGAFDSSWRGK